MKWILAVLIPFVFVYLIFGFITWNLNPGQWAEESRMLASMLGCAFLIPSLGIAGEVK